MTMTYGTRNGVTLRATICPEEDPAALHRVEFTAPSYVGASDNLRRDLPSGWRVVSFRAERN
jgi:hypothetical protein